MNLCVKTMSQQQITIYVFITYSRGQQRGVRGPLVAHVDYIKGLQGMF